MNFPVFNSAALALIIERDPKRLPRRFDCPARDRFEAAVLTSHLVRHGFTCVVDAQTHRIEARGEQHAKLNGDYTVPRPSEPTPRTEP